MDTETNSVDETKGPYCEWCGEEKEYDDLMEVDNSDRSVGYVSIDWMCSECRGKRRIARASW